MEAILGMIWPLSLAQNDFNDPKLFTGAQAINILNSGGRLGAFQVHFGLKEGVKSSPEWLQYLTLRPPNGPKFARIGLKMVPIGPHQYFRVMVSPTIHYFGLFRSFWDEEREKIHPKLASISCSGASDGPKFAWIVPNWPPKLWQVTLYMIPEK